MKEHAVARAIAAGSAALSLGISTADTVTTRSPHIPKSAEQIAKKLGDMCVVYERGDVGSDGYDTSDQADILNGHMYLSYAGALGINPMVVKFKFALPDSRSFVQERKALFKKHPAYVGEVRYVVDTISGKSVVSFFEPRPGVSKKTCETVAQAYYDQLTQKPVSDKDFEDVEKKMDTADSVLIFPLFQAAGGGFPGLLDKVEKDKADKRGKENSYINLKDSRFVTSDLGDGIRISIERSILEEDPTV